MTRSVLTALVLAALVAGWVLSGQMEPLFSSDTDPVVDETTAVSPAQAAVEAVPRAVSQKPAPTRFKVRATTFAAQERLSAVIARGRTEAIRTVDLRAQTYGRVVAVEAAEGARVAKGDVIVRLATDDRDAKLKEAEALVRQREIEAEAARRLADKGYRSRTNLAANEAALDAARAAVEAMRTEIAYTVIRAPFAGVIEERAAEIGAYLKVGDVVATLVDQNPILVVADLSERDVPKLEIGQPASARLVTGEEVEGRVRFIATMADPATRTFRVEIEVANPKHRMRLGVTAEISLPTVAVRAHRVSPAALTLDDDGVIGVRTVDAEGRVLFRPVDIIADETDGVWIAGLPESVTIITVGQEFVRDGQIVDVVLETADGAR